MRKNWLTLLALATLVILLIYQARIVMAAPPKQGPAESPSVVRGAALWFENCAPCHGARGGGDGPTASALEFKPANFADPEAAKTRVLAEMFDVILNGRMERFMPPWGSRLTEQEIWDAAAYAQSLSVDPADLEAGAGVYAESCASCHGQKGVAEEIDLTQPSLVINNSQQALFDSLRAADGVHVPLADLSDEALWQALAFVNTLSIEYPSYDGVVQGRVVNATTGEAAPDTRIALYALSPNGEVLQTYTTTSDADGNFTFTHLNPDHTLSYTLEGIYQGVSYTSPEPAVFLPDSPNIELDLPVYETTDDPQGLTQERLHRIIAFEPGQVTVADVYVFNYSGDRAFVGQLAADGFPGTVKIGIPANATNVNFQNDFVRPVDDYYLSAQPIVPGNETLISVTYNVPIEGASQSLETPLFYDVPLVNVIAADQGQVINSEQLVSQGVETFQGNTYQLLAGTDLQANQSFVMALEDLNKLNLPDAASTNPNAVVQGNTNQSQTTLLWSIMAVGGLALIISLVYSARMAPPATQEMTLAGEKMRLLALLTELEALHQAGEIDEQTYHQARSQNRALLKQILVQLPQHEGMS